MRKIMMILSSAFMLLALAACGNTQGGNPAAAASADKKVEQANSKGAKGKTLVVYYSASGVTKNVAGTIAETLQGDTFELIPAEQYSAADLDYRDSNSRVCKEHDDSNRSVKLVSTTVPNWQDYDTVFIGYPIWWGIAAWPVDNFVKENDFTGKKVITFATAASSGFGQSGKLLQNMSKNGNWVEGTCFHGTQKGAVQSWLNTLGF